MLIIVFELLVIMRNLYLELATLVNPYELGCEVGS